MKSQDAKKAAEALLEQGVGTKDQYLKAVPMVFEMQRAIKSTRDWLSLLVDVGRQLGEAAAAYALDHATALDEPLAERRQGVRSGTVDIGGKTYRLTLSLDDAKRMSGGNLTQEFLARLPSEWTAEKLELKQSALKGMSAEELAQHDLHRDVKRVWSVAEA